MRNLVTIKIKIPVWFVISYWCHYDDIHVVVDEKPCESEFPRHKRMMMVMIMSILSTFDTDIIRWFETLMMVMIMLILSTFDIDNIRWFETLRKRIPSPQEALHGLHWSTMKLQDFGHIFGKTFLWTKKTRIGARELKTCRNRCEI